HLTMHICTQYFYFHATAFVQSTVELIWWEAGGTMPNSWLKVSSLSITFKTRTFSKQDSLGREYHVSSKAVNVSYNHLPVDV
ncbi:MAG: hypothetical protein PWK00_08575, partial [Coxiella burnetii]|nr:hypothetical protein [Coxiella burnetii]